MATIYLKHPVHGSKVANIEAEAQADEKNGWERYDVEDPSVEAPTLPVVTEREIKADRDKPESVPDEPVEVPDFLTVTVEVPEPGEESNTLGKKHGKHGKHKS